MRIIGLTGGIASGKSAVAGIISGMGIPVIDADLLAREAVIPGSLALRAIADTFGDGVIDSEGRLDRAALANIVFSDNTSRIKLESILHPAIKDLAEKRLAELREAGNPAVVYMAALLLEAKATDRVDEIWVVYANRETQIERIRARDNLCEEDAMKRISAQMPMDEKARYGRIVIDNNGSMDELREKVLTLLKAENLVRSLSE